MRKVFEKISNYLSKIEVDKWMHFNLVMLISFIITEILKVCNLGCAYSLIAGFAFGTAVGIIKELWDKKNGEKFDWMDIKADVFGATIGAIMGVL
jgi:uncharacterized protein YfiM (DUF2279 family)